MKKKAHNVRDRLKNKAPKIAEGTNKAYSDPAYSRRTYSVSEARENFASLLSAVEQGEDVDIVKHGKPIATITPPQPVAKKKHTVPPPGYLEKQGWKINIADDFDAIPEGFKDYI